MSGTTTTEPAACYGLACPQRGTCALFVAVETSDADPIRSCQTADGWPLYRQTQRAALDELHRIDGELFGGIDP